MRGTESSRDRPCTGVTRLPPCGSTRARTRASWGTRSLSGSPFPHREDWLRISRTAWLGKGGASHSFEKGSIVWSPANGAFVSEGAIRAAWLKTDAQNGKLGYPITDEITFSGGVKQHFEGGVIVWTAEKRVTEQTERAEVPALPVANSRMRATWNESAYGLRLLHGDSFASGSC
ncbi:LGFP repeat-containing protein [Arthrobacter sp. NPDC093125]|uniref:LGFP repeat-containing protein n=1 Tax=Arthrobacter sp. NPDC093125 TaxID=3363944 RepID=UPI00380BC16D